jgi:glycosyltransferase involved in cell wall biosynthesis
LKIGLVVYGSLDVVSGGNLYDRKLVEHLRERGHEVEVLSLPHRAYPLALADNLRRGFSRRLEGLSLDVLLEDELVHPSLFRLNRSIAKDAGAPLVAIVHHLRSSELRPAWQNDLYRRVEKIYLASVDAFVFNSQETRETVESLLLKKTRNVVATPGGDRLKTEISSGEVELRAREPGPLRLLFVGNVIERKGLAHLFEALGGLSPERFRLDVVGSLDREPSYASRIHRQVRRLGLEDRVTFHGTLDGDALAERFRASQVLAVPSTYEGFGIVFLEAMGFGLTVIAGAAGATDEIVGHESTGFLVQPGDTRSLAYQLDRLAEDRELLARMSATALEAFRERPSWSQSMAEVERLCRELTKLSRK